MKFPRLGRFVGGFFLLAISGNVALGQVTISNFSTTNPLDTFGATWATPVDQWLPFSGGARSGQEITSVGGGNPAEEGYALRDGLSLDLSGESALELIARLRPGHAASEIRIALIDSDGTSVVWILPSSSFSASAFTAVSANLADGVELSAGSTPGMNYANVQTFQLSGALNHDTTTAFRVQFDELAATPAPVPEPAAYAMVTALVLVGVAGILRGKAARAKV